MYKPIPKPMPHSQPVFLLLILLLYLTNSYGQASNNLGIFNRTTIGQDLPMPSAPEPATFPRVDRNALTPSVSQTTFYPAASLYNQQNRIEQQNRELRQHADAIINADNAKLIQALAKKEQDLMAVSFYRKQMEWMEKTKAYQQAFRTLSSYNPDSFSLAKAVFTIENAFLGNTYKYAGFEKALQRLATVVKQVLKSEKLDPANNTALNYGIMKLYQQHTGYSQKTKPSYALRPFRYDFDDFRGEKDYTKLFVTKMLLTGKGQCHSMPLVYLMIAEQLGAKAWLSLAPQHSFIQFADNNNNLVSFETTNGHLVSPNWLQQSGFINANALKSKTYLDTLSQRRLYAQCLADLLLGYMATFDYDDFAEWMRQKIVQVDPNNLTAAVIDANVKTQFALQQIRAAGRPKVQDLPNYPAAYQAYLAMHVAYDRVDGLGYQDMPKEAYQQ